jgi:holo-[acyl-carrier protein] synthase
VSLRGVGIDITDVHRIARLVESHGVRFTRRWFTPAEIAECDASGRRTQAFAARFAAKEAVWKALGIEWNGPVPWRSIAVLHTDGDPTVQLSGEVADAAYASGLSRITITVTVGQGRATALAIAEHGVAGGRAPATLTGPGARAGWCSS